MISAFSSGDWDHFLKEITKYKALTNSHSLTQEETSHERIKCQSFAGKCKWFPVQVECCQKSEIRNQKTEIRNQKSENGNQKSETRNQKSEIRNQKPEIRNPKSEIRNQKPEIRNQKPEIRNQKPEIRNPKPVVRRREWSGGRGEEGRGRFL